jgi:hypothetical protein
MSTERDWLTRALEDRTPIDDGGFTEAVVRVLPRARRGRDVRFVVVPAFAAVACAAAWELTRGWGTVLASAAAEVQARGASGVAASLSVAAMVAMLLAGALAVARGD